MGPLLSDAWQLLGEARAAFSMVTPFILLAMGVTVLVRGDRGQRLFVLSIACALLPFVAIVLVGLAAEHG